MISQKETNWTNDKHLFFDIIPVKMHSNKMCGIVSRDWKVERVRYQNKTFLKHWSSISGSFSQLNFIPFFSKYSSLKYEKIPEKKIKTEKFNPIYCGFVLCLLGIVYFSFRFRFSYSFTVCWIFHHRLFLFDNGPDLHVVKRNETTRKQHNINEAIINLPYEYTFDASVKSTTSRQFIIKRWPSKDTTHNLNT